MSDLCELCGGEALESVYAPERSSRGLQVYLCRGCGLVQSLPRIDRAPRAPAAVSGGADWGNIRYGKAFRAEAVLNALRAQTDLTADLVVLDVGSNRGSFGRMLLEAAPRATLVAVEPDERVASSCASLERTELICARIEDVPLENERFDIIHSCHTIEHLAHPGHVLDDHWRTLKPGGLLVLDAPNIAIIGAEDIVEEWFIDKHLYHFSPRTLTRLLQNSGFEIVSGPEPGDRENLLIVARKSPRRQSVTFEEDGPEVRAAEDLLALYIGNRARNLIALTTVAAELARYAPRRVAIWGAGRLFDALVTHGGYSPGLPALLIDTHLSRFVSERFGVPVAKPEAIAAVRPEVIVVMSRRFADEIAREARLLVPEAEIVAYADLLARARLAQAA
jgi:SAM-dependent methyltransferase